MDYLVLSLQCGEAAVGVVTCKHRDNVENVVPGGWIFSFSCCGQVIILLL